MSETKFRYHGKIYEVKEDGTELKALTKNNVKAGEGISIDEDGDNIIINSDLGISVVNGILCATYSKEV